MERYSKREVGEGWRGGDRQTEGEGETERVHERE